MRRLVLRADDLGYSEAVNYGLAKACDNGLPMSVGLMVNMEAVEHGYGLVKDAGHCLGIHTNISAGRPVSDPADVPSLVGENGCFKPSSLYYAAEEDPASLEDVERECEAQYQAFVALTGREPDYVDIHAVASAHFFGGVANVAARHGRLFSALPPAGCLLRIGSTDVWLQISSANEADPLRELRAIVEAPAELGTHMLVFDLGYVDWTIMTTFSVNVVRALEAETLRSTALRETIERAGIELITYRDL